jgi:hypothetical protein
MTTPKPPSRLQLWALRVAIGAACGAIALEILKVSFGHPARWEGMLAALVILVIAFSQLPRTRRHRSS